MSLIVLSCTEEPPKSEFDMLEFEKPGYIIEFTNNPMNIADEVVNYIHQYIEGKIEVFER